MLTMIVHCFVYIIITEKLDYEPIELIYELVYELEHYSINGK